MLHAHANYAIARDADMGRRKYIHPQLSSGYTQTHTKTQKHKKPSNTCKTILRHRTFRCSTQESKMTFDILLSPPTFFCIISLAPVLFCISIIKRKQKEIEKEKKSQQNQLQTEFFVNCRRHRWLFTVCGSRCRLLHTMITTFSLLINHWRAESKASWRFV